MIGRISTFAASQRALTQSLSTQAKLADAQNQESSGLKSDSFSGIADSAGDYLTLASQAARLNADVASVQTFSQMQNQAYSTLGSIADLATTMRTALAATQNGNSASTTLATSADQWRNDIASLLNTKFGDSYLFAGAATQIAPVDLSSYDGNTATSDAPVLTYYKGSSDSRALTTSTFQTDMPVKASDSGFEKLLRAASLLSNASTDNTTISSAYDLITQATSEIARSQALVSSRAGAASSFITSAGAQLNFAQDSANDIKGSDVAEATLHVTQFQTQLEAAYSSLTVLMKVNLLDYLR